MGHKLWGLGLLCCPVPCGLFTSIPGFYPRDSDATHQALTMKNVARIANYLLGWDALTSQTLESLCIYD